MNLAQLKKMLETVETYGFSDEQVQIEMNYTFSKMEVVDTKFVVSVDGSPKASLKLELDCKKEKSYV
jgi:hypothetical protein